MRCQILRLKCTKFDFGWGSALDPAGGAYSAPPDPLIGLKGLTFIGKEGRGRGEEGNGKREREWEGKGRRRERRRGEGKKGRGRRHPRFLPELTPMHISRCGGRM